jgi:hypothetical protein
MMRHLEIVRLLFRALRLVVLFAFLALLDGGHADAADAWVTVRPPDNGEALVNPGMGWTLQFYSNLIENYGSKLEPSDTLDDWPGLSVIYPRVPWSFLEPKEGEFNWSLFDTPAQRWIAGIPATARTGLGTNGWPNWLPFGNASAIPGAAVLAGKSGAGRLGANPASQMSAPPTAGTGAIRPTEGTGLYLGQLSVEVPVGVTACSPGLIARTAIRSVLGCGLFYSLRAGNGRDPVPMPGIIPEIFELYQFHMAVGQREVDGTGHSLAGVKIPGSAGGIVDTMPENGATSHLGLSNAGVRPGTIVKIAAGWIGFQWADIHEVGIGKHLANQHGFF